MSKRSDRPAPTNVDTKHRIVGYLICNDPAIGEWLEELGLIATDDARIWLLTPAGEAAIARLPQRQAPAPLLN